MNKFQPSQDYAGLLIQARAMATIISCMEVTANAGSKYVIAKLKGQIESEKEMNAILTAENEELKARMHLMELAGKP
jgi:cell division protein FtsB